MSKQGSPDDVWQLYRSALTSFLQSRVSNKADVEDLLQDILLKVHKTASPAKKTGSLKSWLFQIANHAIIDFYRRRSRTAVIAPEDLWFDAPDEDDIRGLEGCVLPFIDALPAETADLLRQIEVAGISQKDYAQQIGVSYSTLKSRVQKARIMLRQVFDDCCDFERDQRGQVVGFVRKSNTCEDC